MSRKTVLNFAPAVAVMISLWSFSTYAQPTPTPIRYRLSIADKPVALEVTLGTVSRSAIKPGDDLPSAFIDPSESFSKNGDAAQLLAIQPSKNPGDLTSLIIVVEPATQVVSAEAFRAFALKKFSKNAWDIKHSDYKGISVARYTTDSSAARMAAQYGVTIPGAKSTVRNLEAFLVSEHAWATIKFTAGSLGAEEEKLFYSIIESAKFVDTSRLLTSFDYYSLGQAFHAKKDYRRAADHFGSAVKLEQAQEQLNPRHWRNLIMNAAETYVANSDPKAAAQVLEYGVKREPTNETFLMQLARTYALLRDTEKTLATLEQAFLIMKKQKEVFEKTTFPGTTSHSMSLPDLNRDPAFKEMLKDKTFRDAVKAMKKSG